MEGVFAVLFIVFNFLLLPHPSSSLPLCTDSWAPLTVSTKLEFCSYNGSSCCNSTDDSKLQKQFQAMNISDPSCASLLQSVLCARCDPFSAKLFTIDSGPRPVPLLCNSTVSTNSSQSNQATNDFCSQVWDTCQNVLILNSPFAPSLQGQAGAPVNSNFTKLTELWQSKTDFCDAFGGASTAGSICYEGEPVTLNETGSPSAPHGLCLEKIGEGNYLDMVAHPDGSNRAFFSNQQGCSGRCSCNSDVNCDPSKLRLDNGDQPCQYQSVIAEYTANGTASQPSLAENARPSEVRRIFTMGLPFTSQHGGQILFGPTDGYLYFMTGDGGGGGDPYNFSQNKKSILGKIMRLDIDTIPSTAEINRLGLWGNYSIPKDNPFSEDEDLLPEIWAFGLRNPWPCSFDLERPSYFMCADVGENLYEEVDIISKGGNYGWRVYEGLYPFDPTSSPGGNTQVNSISPILPVMGYNHSEVNKKVGSASIIGGYFYRSNTDPCMYGRYLYADLYAGAIWAATEDPENSGNFSTNTIPFACARDSPLECSTVPASTLAALGYIYSFGQDNSKDIYLLTSSGVYRVAAPSRCSYTCSKENVTAVASPSPTTSPPSHANQLSPVILLSALLLLMAGLA
ncbi:hypothetical protein ES332_A03G089100v1 [Gossypium tomentosum]|uniref:Glucose/Sorbosone dehydrogenase domain-containing protein n=1 Tax=Gossypium tomentosum TaxID=34277 RepID=A0A5D2R7D1_GOSTO|nr:hypothetical protein ES332_A03G089100v1 [Gossypium tomentosum]